MRKAELSYLVAIVFASGVLCYLSLYEGHAWGDDFSAYIKQAKCLVEGTAGDCLVESSFTIANSSYPLGPDVYPWGFPLLLGPVYYALGLDIFAMKLYMLLFFLLSLFAIFLVFRERLGRLPLILLVSLFAFNPVFIEFTNHVLSDLPYQAFSLFSIFLISRFAAERKFFVNRTVSFTLLGLFIFFSYLVRPNGVALLGALFACQAVEGFSGRRDLKAFLREVRAAVLPYAVFAALLFLTGIVLPRGSATYAGHLSVITPGLLIENLAYYAFLFADFFGKHQPTALFVATAVFAAAGIAMTWRRDFLFIVYSLLTLLIFMAWPYKQGVRFIFSILPFYMYFSFAGIREVSGVLSKRLLNKDSGEGILKAAGLALTTLFLFQSISSAYPNIGGRRTIDGPFTAASSQMFGFVRDFTGKDEVVVFFKPRALSLLTDRRAVMVTEPSEITGGRWDYLIIHKRMGGYNQIPPGNAFFEVFGGPYGTLRKIFENSDFIIYRIA